MSKFVIPVVGLTGGIACGKSTVADLFRSEGVACIDADVLARLVVEPGGRPLAEIVSAFGREVLDDEGRLDRDALGTRVFGDTVARRRLEAILHPAIAAAAEREVRALAEAGHGWVLYEAALLVETGLHRELAALIVVRAEPEQQVARLQARNGLAEGEARARLAAQLPIEDKVAVADYVIDNSGALDATAHRVKAVLAALVARFGPHR